MVDRGGCGLCGTSRQIVAEGMALLEHLKTPKTAKELGPEAMPLHE